MQLIPRAGLTITPWPNGAGRKADIAAGDGWLVAFAFLDGDAPFSDYSGHDRTITLIDGPGFTLHGADGTELSVAQPFTPTPFDGGWTTACRLHATPCMVVNAMTRRAGWRHAVTLLPAPAILPPSTATADILVALTGAPTINDSPLTRHDAMRLGTGSTTISGVGLLCRLQIFPV